MQIMELLAPAKNITIAREAILHGADAVYIGGPYFGARYNAGNTIEEIAELVSFAHLYQVRIFVTLNTILHDSELELAQKLIYALYEIGVDALIIQDMGLLELDLPPIQLHASTQCDIRTVEKAKFLAEVGFSQLVLARELSIQEVSDIAKALPKDIVIEYFIHGALCVAFSGQCYISHAETGRSANRGDCSQACRLPYTLSSANGEVIAYEKHLLSMKDNNQSENLEALLKAGVRSFKIEGRYKEMAYVKNITAFYNQLLNKIIEDNPMYSRASSGSSECFFIPHPDKTFNRSSTDYFAQDRKLDIGAFDSPKFAGMPIGTVQKIMEKALLLETYETLHNGDGLSFLTKRVLMGLKADIVEQQQEGLWLVMPQDKTILRQIKPGMTLFRNKDHAWEASLAKNSAQRLIALTMQLSYINNQLSLKIIDEDNITIESIIEHTYTLAKNPEKMQKTIQEQLVKLGNTLFFAKEVIINLKNNPFIPVSIINSLRRQAIEALLQARINAWQRPERKPALSPPSSYPETVLSYLGNVYNQKAWQFYKKHGVSIIQPAFEAHQETEVVSLMITKHCLRYSFSLCPKQAKEMGVKPHAEPLVLQSEQETYTLKFDCKACEMHVLGSAKKHILKQAPASIKSN